MSRDISRIVWIVYLATQLLAAAGFALMVANFASTPGPVPSRAYATAFMAVRWLGCFIRFWALAQIIFYIGNVRDGWRRKSVLAFGGLYAGLLIIHYGLLLLPLPTAIFALVYPTAYFASDLVPLIYLLAVLRKESWGIPALSSRAGGLNGLDGFGELTKREREIVSLILSGKDNIDIHRALYISAGTVRNHVSNIYKKLGLKNRYQLLALARKDVGID